MYVCVFVHICVIMWVGICVHTRECVGVHVCMHMYIGVSVLECMEVITYLTK
jgi:hypothetical protein